MPKVTGESSPQPIAMRPKQRANVDRWGIKYFRQAVRAAKGALE